MNIQIPERLIHNNNRFQWNANEIALIYFIYLDANAFIHTAQLIFCAYVCIREVCRAYGMCVFWCKFYYLPKYELNLFRSLSPSHIYIFYYLIHLN